MEEGKKTAEGKSTAAVVGTIVAQIIFCAVCVAAGWIIKGMIPEKKAGAAGPGGMMMPNAVQTIGITNVQMRAYNRPQKYVAHAEAVQEVPLLPQVEGYVKEIKFKEGDIVEEGQILYVIDDERYAAVVNQRKADLAAAEAEERRATRYHDRMQKADDRGITQLERDNAEAGAERASAAVLQAKANLIVAEYDMNHAVVKAPFRGQIGKTSAHIGDYVSSSKGALAYLVQLDPIRVRCQLTDREYNAIRNAAKSGDNKKVERRARLILPTGEAYNEFGQFDFVDNSMSAQTATMTIWFNFANPDRFLVPNTFLTLMIDMAKPPEYPSVPQTAIFDLPGGNVGVWVVDDEMKVHARAVKTLEHFEGWVPILEGLEGGEKIVIAGTSKLSEGRSVAPVEPTETDEMNPNRKTYEERTGEKGAAK